ERPCRRGSPCGRGLGGPGTANAESHLEARDAERFGAATHRESGRKIPSTSCFHYDHGGAVGFPATVPFRTQNYQPCRLPSTPFRLGGEHCEETPTRAGFAPIKGTRGPRAPNDDDSPAPGPQPPPTFAI